MGAVLSVREQKEQTPVSTHPRSTKGESYGNRVLVMDTL